MLTPKYIWFKPANHTCPRLSKRSTIAMLRKLLATKIVANNFFGFSSNKETVFIFLEALLVDCISRSVGVKEKNATSAPEIRAENKRSIKSTTILIIKGLSISAKNNKLGGSISKIVELVTT